MKAAVLLAPNEMRVEDRPVPQPGPEEVRLRVLLAGICTTDVHIYRGHFPVSLPRILGHELVGEVDAIGPGVPSELIGKICGISPARFCGDCYACRRDLPELCLNFECLGNTHDGGFAEYTLVKTHQLQTLDGVFPNAAVWLEPLGCVLHALQTAQAESADKLLITGAGVYGKLTLLAARVYSKASIAMIDPNPEKAAEAVALGAQAGWTVPRIGPIHELDREVQDWAPEGVGAVIDTSGVPTAVERAVKWMAPGGRIVLFGVSSPDTCLSIDPGLIFSRQLTLTAAAGMTPSSFEQAYYYLKNEVVDPTILAAGVVSLYEVQKVLENPVRTRKGKILVRPSEMSSEK
jgi:D-arabinitol dehydrogenase (NADP+)